MSADARQFPCEQCGAKVVFAPGTAALRCPYCGFETHIPSSTEGIEERAFFSVAADFDRAVETEEVRSVQCDSCGAAVEPLPTHESFPCPYCGSSIVARELSQRRIKPAALLPFHVNRAAATKLFRSWIRKLWFAPNALKRLARIEDRLLGLYVPYWTYDANTASRYSGQRGDNYMVTRTRTVMRDGRPVQETYQEVRIRWRPAAGHVTRAFDDMLVVGSKSLPRPLAEALEPWDLHALVAFRDEYLSGFTTERYQIGVREGWTRARHRMELVIRDDVAADIGGDHQRIHTLETTHKHVTFKHVLLPVWICSYRYKDEIYRFMVNARTGEVQGQRPWSVVKIALAVVATVALVFLIARFSG